MRGAWKGESWMLSNFPILVLIFDFCQFIIYLCINCSSDFHNCVGNPCWLPPRIQPPVMSVVKHPPQPAFYWGLAWADPWGLSHLSLSQTWDNFPFKWDTSVPRNFTLRSRVAKTCRPCRPVGANFSWPVLTFGQSTRKTMPLCPMLIISLIHL